jgi:hypothetical protein
LIAIPKPRILEFKLAENACPRNNCLLFLPLALGIKRMTPVPETSGLKAEK